MRLHELAFLSNLGQLLLLPPVTAIVHHVHMSTIIMSIPPRRPQDDDEEPASGLAPLSLPAAEASAKTLHSAGPALCPLPSLRLGRRSIAWQRLEDRLYFPPNKCKEIHRERV